MQKRGNAELARMDMGSGSSTAAHSGSTAVSSWHQGVQQSLGEECAPERFPLPQKKAWFDKVLDVCQNLTEGGHF